ncbi:MAG: hypothetical protein IJR12_09470 [Bacteroidales bacterium]|nr:hypothetical protein [Bacteroidales bacterium]
MENSLSSKNVDLAFLTDTIPFGDDIEERLFKYARNASGLNLVLEKGEFEKLYPAEFQELAQQAGMDVDTLNRSILWSNSMSTRAFGQAVARAGNINGTGGHTSFGGGGGSFGGGFGGGAR